MKKRRWGFLGICAAALFAAVMPAIQTTSVQADSDSATGTATVEFQGGGLVLEQVPNFDFGYHYLGSGQVYPLLHSGTSADSQTQLGDRSLAVAATPEAALTNGWSVSVRYSSDGTTGIPTGTYLLLTSTQIGQNNPGTSNAYNTGTLGAAGIDSHWLDRHYQGGITSTDLNKIQTSSTGTIGVVPLGGTQTDTTSVFGRDIGTPDTTLNPAVTTTGKVEYKYFFNTQNSAYIFVPVGKQQTAALTGTLEWTLQKGIPQGW